MTAANVVTTVHIVVPDGIDDPARPSGGNVYDRRISHGLDAIGWTVHEHAVAGCWPRPDAAACAALTRVIAAVPDGGVVLIDGLIASTVPEVLVPEAGRLRLVILVHAPLGAPPAGGPQPEYATVGGAVRPDLATARARELATAAVRADFVRDFTEARARECAVLSAASAVITTSVWARAQLLDLYPVPRDRVHVAAPGVDPAALVPGTARGAELLCVAAVTPLKGHDVLIAALAASTDLRWRCVCAGSLDRDPGFVARLCIQAREAGIADRVIFAGPRTRDEVDAAYAASDLLVLASRSETYGMVVTEALARGLPVIAASVGGVPEALGRTADGVPPGLLVPSDDPVALASVLRNWLIDADLRSRLRRAAGDRRTTLTGWSVTTEHIARALATATA